MWKVELDRKATKQVKKLPQGILRVLFILIKDLTKSGPSTGGGWKNYSKLRGFSNKDFRHCHLVKGKPTYVCCWEVIDKKLKIIEVYYVGTHEKAPY